MDFLIHRTAERPGQPCRLPRGARAALPGAGLLHRRRALGAGAAGRRSSRFLGPDAPRWVAYPAAAGAGSLLAVCSCTVQPLFAGIYKKGAGLGPAITFLFFAPAANILALSYTGVALGAEFAIARIVLALSFGIGIGMIMAMIFRRSEARTSGRCARLRRRRPGAGTNLLFLGTLVALLIAGTLKVDCSLPRSGSKRWPGRRRQRAGLLDRWVPANEAYRCRRPQPAGRAADRAARADRCRRMARPRPGRQWLQPLTWLALALTVLTLAFAAVGLRVTDAGLTITSAAARSPCRCSAPRCCRRRAASRPGTCSSGCGKPGASSK
jgi:hypothetical protein